MTFYKHVLLYVYVWKSCDDSEILPFALYNLSYISAITVFFKPNFMGSFQIVG